VDQASRTLLAAGRAAKDARLISVGPGHTGLSSRLTVRPEGKVLELYEGDRVIKLLLAVDRLLSDIETLPGAAILHPGIST
jgi:hypothetical protein